METTTQGNPEPEVVTANTTKTQRDPGQGPPVTEAGKPDTSDADAAQTAVEKALFPEENATDFEFGGIKFKVRQLPLRRERKFLKLFPVLQGPFERFTELVREEEGAAKEVRQRYAAEIAALQERLREIQHDLELDMDGPAEFARLAEESRKAAQRLAEIDALIAASRTGLWQFVISTISESGESLLDVLVMICANSLDFAKPGSVTQEIDVEWVELNLHLSDIVDVIGSQIVEQSWGNFFKRVAVPKA